MWRARDRSSGGYYRLFHAENVRIETDPISRHVQLSLNKCTLLRHIRTRKSYKRGAIESNRKEISLTADQQLGRRHVEEEFLEALVLPLFEFRTLKEQQQLQITGNKLTPNEPLFQCPEYTAAPSPRPDISTLQSRGRLYCAMCLA